MDIDPARGPGEIRLPFEPGDRFIQVHRNRAILVVADDYQWNLATVGQAVAVALEAVEHGTRILIGYEVLDDDTVAVLDAVRDTGVTVVDFGTVIPPMTWPNGTAPLMSAVTLGRHDLVEDLLARGVDPGDVDVAGGTALHRAAHAGDVAMCEMLLAAGADPGVRSDDGRSPADLAAAAGHHELAARLDPDERSAPPAPAEPAEGDVRLPRGAPVGFLYEVLGVAVSVLLFGSVAFQLRNLWSLPVLAVPVVVVWMFRHLFWAGGPLRIQDGALRLLTLRGMVSVPLASVRGVLVAPAHGLNGSSWKLVLCQDLTGRTSTPRRLRSVDPALVSVEDAERFAGVAARHQVVVLGRGTSTDTVFAALRPGLDRPDVAANRWWHELARHDALHVMTSLHRRI